MVFVDPDTFKMVTQNPTDSTDLDFQFNYQYDTGNWFAVLPFSVIFTLQYRPTKSSTDITGWIGLGTKVVEIVPNVNGNPIKMTANKKISMGKYDFMVIEAGDLAGAGRSDLTRYGFMTVEIGKDCSDRTMWCTPGCINEPYVTCLDCEYKSGCGTACETDACATGCPKSLLPECTGKECDITCQLTKAIEPIKQYIPYIVVGVAGIVILGLLFKKKPKPPASDSTTLAAQLVGAVLNGGKGRRKDNGDL